MTRHSPDYPFHSAEPLPPCYDLPTTLRVLGLNTRQAFRQSGLAAVLRPLPAASRITLYAAVEVQQWARRLARLRILQAWGERGPKTPLVQAPAGDGRDAICPRCGGFALRAAEARRLRCINGHEEHSQPR